MSSGRIEREVISITSGRDGGASLAELRGMRQKPGMYETWQDVARRLGAIVGAWGCLYWFVSIIVRGRGVAGWEVAGLVVALVVVASVAKGEKAAGR